MLKLRLTRGGKKRKPTYRIVVIKSDARREGRPIENVGYYNPLSKQCVIDKERVLARLNQGVQPSSTVKNLLVRSGIISL